MVISFLLAFRFLDDGSSSMQHEPNDGDGDEAMPIVIDDEAELVLYFGRDIEAHPDASVRQRGLPSDSELRQGVSKALEILATYSNSPRQTTKESSRAEPADAVEPSARDANDPPVSASKKKREKAKARKAAAALAAPCRPDEPTA